MNYSVLHTLVKKMKNDIWCLNNLWFDCVPGMINEYVDKEYVCDKGYQSCCVFPGASGKQAYVSFI